MCPSGNEAAIFGVLLLVVGIFIDSTIRQYFKNHNLKEYNKELVLFGSGFTAFLLYKECDFVKGFFKQ